MAADHGRFSSTRDHPQVLRVLYNKLSDNTTIDKVNPKPEQVDIIYLNILSDPISSFFRDVLALDCGTGFACIRLSKPFRPLIRNLQPLRDHLNKLEKAYGYENPESETDYSTTPTETDAAPSSELTEPESTSTAPPDADTSEHHEKPFLRPSALNHFRTVVKFADQYLHKSLELYEKLKLGKEDKVAFENLWMLFDTGTMIYCPYRSGKEVFWVTDALADRTDSDCVFTDFESRARYSPQAYRVLSVRGGVPLKTSLMPGEVEEDFDENDFLQNVDAMLRLDRLDLFRHGDEVIVDFKTAFEQSSDLPDILEIRPDFETKTEWPRTTEGSQPEAHDWYRHDEVDGERSISHRWCYANNCQRPSYYEIQDAESQKILQQIALAFESHATQQAKSKKARGEFRSYLENTGLIKLFPGIVPGYALRNRKWVQLDIDRLQDVQRGDNWDNLVLPKGHREMVQAMVESYTRRLDDSQATYDQPSEKVDLDLVRGKGKGCIILLHGAPGVGKTSTAECVAAYTKRPLYPITCGDIGHLPDVVEANLEKHFKLAHRWACVLLLDEADVFLAKRTKTDVKRNGLVSVFLRILEYYPGILFLTTNRVGAIDDAFRSRLHLTLYYPKLLEKQSTKIWKNNIRKLKEVNEQRVKAGQQPIKYDKHEIIKWASTNWESLQWNGRQIRNAFQTAIALAEFNARSRKSRKRTGGETPSPSPKKSKTPVLDQDTFMLIADASSQFNDYLLQTHGYDEEMTASRDQVRPASFKAKPNRIKRVQDSSESDSDSDASSGPSHESDSSSGPGSDTESDASADSESDSAVERKRKKTKTKKGKRKSEKKTKETELPDEQEKKEKKEKKKKKKRSDL
ncbi:hypothetical protein M406DRAFT_286719 [Cryphonectria parasitica EP155]|uniref:AAA+ ATPase domain-containing protein n=1 Tax=Cryphonectria parasitica (strain ATCC 38755 / EP155) TaxID=660469 RepID=A0A9P5CRM8_CRYP1|nr:uncharacterized protein M406DRAFT_286719 [Cryphonectria parasitica EP155]KAF3768739.1 hypothetical protein M406DRAFT_286719 [Cryphonectria parasitica EP155]